MTLPFPNSPLGWLRLSGVLLALALLAYFSFDEIVNRPSINEAQELAYLSQGEIQSMEVLDVCECDAKHFRVLLNEAQVRQLQSALRSATIMSVPGHSSRTSEAKMRVRAAGSLLEYDVIVVKQRPNDLFLWRYVDGGGSKWYYQALTVPGFAHWLTEVAPDAAV